MRDPSLFYVDLDGTCCPECKTVITYDGYRPNTAIKHKCGELKLR